MKQLAIALALLLFFSIGAAAQGFFIELQPSYYYGLGSGMPFLLWGDKDTTLTYANTTYGYVGGNDINVGGMMGFFIGKTFAVLAGFNYSFGSNTFKDAYSWVAQGVANKFYQYENAWTFMTIPVGMRFYSSDPGFRLFAGAGVLAVLPPSINLIVTDTEPLNVLYKKNYSIEYNLGVGAYCELGFEFPIVKTVKLSLSIGGNLVTLSRSKMTVVYTDIAGSTSYYYYTYVDNPQTFGDQTATDVANSVGANHYYTYPISWTNYSTFSINLGITFLF